MRIADDEIHAGKQGKIFGRALSVAAGSDDARGGVCAMDGANRTPRLSIGRSGNRAGIHDNDVGCSCYARNLKAARAQLILDGGGIGLSGAAAELFDKKSGHGHAQGLRKVFYYSNARTRAGGFLLPGTRVLPQDAFFALP